MPYLRGSTRNPYNNASTGLATKRDVYKLYRSIKATKPELKYIETQTSGSMLTNTSAVHYLTDVNQGTNYDNRISNKIKVVRIDIRGMITSNNTGFLNNNLHIVRCKADNVPVTGDFTDSQGSFTDHEKFEELYYKQGLGSLYSTNIVKTIKLKYPIVVHYNGTVGANVVRNPIYGVIRNPSNGNTQNFDISYRVWYHDI